MLITKGRIPLGFMTVCLMTLVGTAVHSQEKEKVEKGEKKPATIEILLPDVTKIELKIEGLVTKATGTKRSFKTPPLDPGKTYPYQYACFRVTDYRSDAHADLLISGRDLKHDLELFVRRVECRCRPFPLNRRSSRF